FEQAIANLARVLAEAGGQPADLLSVRVYVTDKREYVAARRAVGAAWRKHLGRHFPAMALLEGKALLEEGAKGEIEGRGAVGGGARAFRFGLGDDGVGTITLDRPETLNSLTFEVYRELTDSLRALASEPSLRALVITGAGRGFCSGGSVHDIIGPLFAMDAA